MGVENRVSNMSVVLQAVQSHRGTRWILFGWSFFLAENVVLSHNREHIIGALGDETYHHMYNTCSTAACASIGYGYMRYGRCQGPSIHVPLRMRPMLATASILCSALGMMGLSQLLPKIQSPYTVRTETETASQSTSVPRFKAQCPFDFSPTSPEGGVSGISRISRHASLWSFGLLGMGSALATTFVSEMALFGFPLVFALIGGAHQDYRYRRGIGGSLPSSTEAVTSNVPFLALLSGSQSWSNLYYETKWTNAGLSLALLLATRRISSNKGA